MTTNPETPTPDVNNKFATLSQADERGAVKGLEPNATYFVFRRPALPFNAEGATSKSKEVINEVKSFVHEHKVLTQRQLEEMRERFGSPKDRARQAREKVEQKFDEVARELEARYEKLEVDIESGLDRILKGKKNGSTESVEVSEGANAATKTPKKKKTPAKKAE